MAILTLFANVERQYQVVGSQIAQLHLLIDNESATAQKLREEYFLEGNINVFYESLAQQLRKKVISAAVSVISCNEASSLVNELLDILLDLHSSDVKKTHDPRIKTALEMLHQSGLQEICL